MYGLSILAGVKYCREVLDVCEKYGIGFINKRGEFLVYPRLTRDVDFVKQIRDEIVRKYVEKKRCNSFGKLTRVELDRVGLINA